MGFDACKALVFSAYAVTFILSGPAHAGPLDPPSPEVLREARSIVQEMQASERGPYTRIRWFCKDGTVQPPQAFACKERGGGRQHAEYSPARERLAVLGWHVGTIFAALEWSSLWEGDERRLRLRQLPLERYLFEVDDGWVLRRARHYRGRVQVEGEEPAGRHLLLELMAQSGWVAEHYLTAAEITRVVPHGTGDDLTRTIRRTAQEIAEKDKGFERLRVEIHSSPTAATADRVRAWSGTGHRASELTKEADTLARELDRLFGVAGRSQRIVAARKRLSRFTAAAEIVRQLGAVEGEDRLASLRRLGRVMFNARQLIADPATNPALRLELFDLVRELEADVRVLTSDPAADARLTRAGVASIILALTDAAYGSGLLSMGEHVAVASVLDPLARNDAIALSEYLRATRTLGLVSTWSVGAVRHAFAEALVRYAALEPRAGYFLDDLLRGSVLLPLSNLGGRLSNDAQRLAGIQRFVFGRPASNLVALNPGLARGPLRVLSDKELSMTPLPIKREDIVVLPEAVAELPPVAGVFTVGESNPLSHVQLLARNFGIPNLSITPDAYRALKEHNGKRLLVAVGTDGSVFVGPDNGQEPAGKNASAAGQDKLQVPEPDLSFREPITLADLNRKLSGRVVGPKAANLGELNRLFPGRVSSAIALPFGIFDQQTRSGTNSPRARLDHAYQASREGRLGAEALTSELESIRQSIAASKIVDPLRSKLSELMEKEFGPAGSYGVFIRSDTNVEDLPGFTGAGLSLTLPHVVGLNKQLDSIPEVWASVLSPRAIAWRSNLLERPERVYASVLLMKSVPSEKSGVLVTTDVFNRAEGLTVTTAWGVGGGVAGETTESLVLQPSGGELLLSEAKSPYRRSLASEGGVRWLPARDGAVLTRAEKDQLRSLAKAVEQKSVAAVGPSGDKLPWDIEFGFVDGELTLFQIRPLIERGQARADRLLGSLLPAPGAVRETVDLMAPPMNQ